ncbi:MAG TPA: ATP-binding protein [Candidatus Acidoferrales bacterium]|jgi:nitrogen fixation/metabolism regulation signal transduction histidine kinase|nr:ATP-binding protein [Candidatus Acidoferrales bacterium]
MFDPTATPLATAWVRLQSPSLRFGGVAAAFTFVLLVVGAAALLLFLMRRIMRGREPRDSEDFSTPKPSLDNPSAFMTASMQAVIQKLREQEKELAALQRRDRERAQLTERLSEAVTRNMPAGLLLIGSAGLITSANPAAEAALDVHALVYRRYAEVLGKESRLSKLVASCLGEARTFRREEVEYVTPKGELRRLGVTISPILGKSRQVSGALCLLSDLTELVALQRQVQVKENLAALGELSAGIAHEFKNALATISGYAQMIRRESQGDTAENAQHIVDQTRALTHVVTEFLKFARPLDLSTEDVALPTVVERVIAEIHEAIPEVAITASGEFESIAGDERLLRQALLNLTRNAAEAADGQAFGGRVEVRGTIEHTPGGDFQRIAVLDNGPGIATDDLSKIFVPFYTTKSNGTGLGLAIVQKIIVQHGGSVEVRNQPQGGAEFVVSLPLSRQDTASHGAVDSHAASV